MERLYFRGDLEDKVRKIGVVDRYVRFGDQRREAHVCLYLMSDGGRRPVIRLSLCLMDAKQQVEIEHALTTYCFGDQREAHMDAASVAEKLGLALLVKDADHEWHIIYDPDTEPVVVPGSIVLWED